MVEYLSPGSRSELQEEDIMVTTMSVDHTAGTQNPLEHVKFFENWDDDFSSNLDMRRMSGFHYESYKVS